MAIDKKMAQELWSHSLVNYSMSCTFGCLAYVHVDNKMLERQSLKCIFLGLKPNVKGFKLCNHKTHKFLF